jgi:hypothetical protein
MDIYPFLVVTATPLREWGPMWFSLYLTISFFAGFFIFKRFPMVKRILFGLLVAVIANYLLAALFIAAGVNLSFC